MNTVRQNRDLFLTVPTGWDLIFTLTPNSTPNSIPNSIYLTKLPFVDKTDRYVGISNIHVDI